MRLLLDFGATKTLSRCLICLSKIGKELLINTTPYALHLSVVDEGQTTHLVFAFGVSFFDHFDTSDEVHGQLPIQYLIRAFRPTELEHVEISSETNYLQIQILCKFGRRYDAKFRFNTGDTRLPSRVIWRHRHYLVSHRDALYHVFHQYSHNHIILQDVAISPEIVDGNEGLCVSNKRVYLLIYKKNLVTFSGKTWIQTYEPGTDNVLTSQSDKPPDANEIYRMQPYVPTTTAYKEAKLPGSFFDELRIDSKLRHLSVAFAISPLRVVLDRKGLLLGPISMTWRCPGDPLIITFGSNSTLCNHLDVIHPSNEDLFNPYAAIDQLLYPQKASVLETEPLPSSWTGILWMSTDIPTDIDVPELSDDELSALSLSQIFHPTSRSISPHSSRLNGRNEKKRRAPTTPECAHSFNDEECLKRSQRSERPHITPGHHSHTYSEAKHHFHSPISTDTPQVSHASPLRGISHPTRLSRSLQRNATGQNLENHPLEIFIPKSPQLKSGALQAEEYLYPYSPSQEDQSEALRQNSFVSHQSVHRKSPTNDPPLDLTVSSGHRALKHECHLKPIQKATCDLEFEILNETCDQLQSINVQAKNSELDNGLAFDLDWRQAENDFEQPPVIHLSRQPQQHQQSITTNSQTCSMLEQINRNCDTDFTIDHYGTASPFSWSRNNKNNENEEMPQIAIEASQASQEKLTSQDVIIDYQQRVLEQMSQQSQVMMGLYDVVSTQSTDDGSDVNNNDGEEIVGVEESFDYNLKEFETAIKELDLSHELTGDWVTRLEFW